MLKNKWNLDKTCSSSTKQTNKQKPQWIETDRGAVFLYMLLLVYLALDIEKQILLIVGQFQKIFIGNLLHTKWEKDKTGAECGD